MRREYGRYSIVRTEINPCSSRRTTTSSMISSSSTDRFEGVPMQSHELLNSHRALAGDFGDDAVFAGEDAVLIIEGDGAEMLDQELRPAIFFQALAISLDRARTVGDGATEDAADCLGDALLT